MYFQADLFRTSLTSIGTISRLFSQQVWPRVHLILAHLSHGYTFMELCFVFREINESDSCFVVIKG